ncbi:MAG: hypothetical protein ABIF85_06885 [Nanoarchaeota archaeon]|nr:hypothetical protein [Nanoarchaeota archaeon]MBU4299843.1 hypothetical protein [Nanoarchaeota archaeon]MBU4451686.1 hypothetical protein [Nanoarchaeota archaeon]MCG2723609.1 hypothetical protein [archaeon]
MSLLLSAILIGVGLFLAFMIEKLKANDTKMYIALTASIILIVAGGWMLYTTVSAELIKRRLWGIIITLFGAYMVFGFPSSTDYQPEGFGYTGVLIGLVSLIGGIYLLLF